MGFWDELGDALEEIGEGVWGATKEVAKFTARTGAVVGAGAAIVSTGGLAAPLIGAGVYLGGKAVKEIAKEEGSKFFESAGDFIEDVGLDGLTGGLFGLGTSTASSLTAREMARNGGRITNGARVFYTINRTIRIGDKAVDLYGKSKNEVEKRIRIYHGQHKGRGIGYDSYCPICNGVWDSLPWLHCKIYYMASKRALILFIKSLVISLLVLTTSYFIFKKYGNYRTKLGRRPFSRFRTTFFISLVFSFISLLGIIFCIISIIFSSLV